MRFWWKQSSIYQHLLTPLAGIYAYFSKRVMNKKQVPTIDLPVLCVGNFTLGGAGKTPTTIALTKSALRLGLKPGIISRGYKGQISNAHLVNHKQDNALMVGDEPLLLSQYATVAIGCNRYQSALLLKNQGCNFILMDDGFQSRRLMPDLALLVVDGLTILGNKSVFPAGPLRAPLKTQLDYTDEILVINNSSMKPVDLSFLTTQHPHFASIVAKPFPLEKGTHVLAFAGIGHPNKFFQSLTILGIEIKEKIVFPDHHYFTAKDLQKLVNIISSNKLVAVTTAKDYMRLRHLTCPDLFSKLTILDIELNFVDKELPNKLIKQTIKKFKERIDHTTIDLIDKLI